MNCRKYRKSLTSTTECDSVMVDALKEHRGSCPACRTFSLRYEAAKDLLAEPAARETDRQPRPGFAAGVIAALPQRPSPLVWVSVRFLPATAALALTLLAWCWLATPTPSELWMQAGEDEVLTWVLSETDDDG